MALPGIELHLPNSVPGEKLVGVILQDETVSWVGYCPVQNAIISKQWDLRLDVHSPRSRDFDQSSMECIN